MSADKALGHDDVPQIASVLCQVQTKSKTFRRVLGLPKVTVDSIHQQNSDPQECLFGVLDEFVKQLEPSPTWRVILEALKNPNIGQGNLAQQIEKKLFPDQYGRHSLQVSVSMVVATSYYRDGMVPRIMDVWGSILSLQLGAFLSWELTFVCHKTFQFAIIYPWLQLFLLS